MALSRTFTARSTFISEDSGSVAWGLSHQDSWFLASLTEEGHMAEDSLKIRATLQITEVLAGVPQTLLGCLQLCCGLESVVV